MATFQLEQEQRHTDLDAAHQEIDQLRDALRTRPVIDQAKGILMAQHGCSPSEAFEMLCGASQRDNRKLRDLAADIVASVQRPATQRTG